MLHFNNYIFEYEMIGEFRSIGNWIHPTRTITSYELIYMLEGTAYIREGSVEYELNKNDILLLSPYIEHAGVRESTSPTSFIWFHFHTNFPIINKHFIGCDCSLLAQFLKQLLHITNSMNYSPAAADALGYLAFEEMTHLSKSERANKNQLSSQIIEYIRTYDISTLTVSDIAKHFGYSTDHIGKLFKNSMGIGLKEYLCAQRVKQIKDMLLTTNKSLKEISQFFGFSDENALCKFFSYHEKTTPTNFRSIAYKTHINHK